MGINPEIIGIEPVICIQHEFCADIGVEFYPQRYFNPLLWEVFDFCLLLLPEINTVKRSGEQASLQHQPRVETYLHPPVYHSFYSQVQVIRIPHVNIKPARIAEFHGINQCQFFLFILEREKPLRKLVSIMKLNNR